MPGWLALDVGDWPKNCHRTSRRRSASAREAWSKQLATGRANFAVRMEEWGRLQTQEDDSWDKLASPSDAIR